MLAGHDHDVAIGVESQFSPLAHIEAVDDADRVGEAGRGSHLLRLLDDDWRKSAAPRQGYQRMSDMPAAAYDQRGLGDERFQEDLHLATTAHGELARQVVAQELR